MHKHGKSKDKQILGANYKAVHIPQCLLKLSRWASVLQDQLSVKKQTHLKVESFYHQNLSYQGLNSKICLPLKFFLGYSLPNASSDLNPIIDSVTSSDSSSDNKVSKPPCLEFRASKQARKCCLSILVDRFDLSPPNRHMHVKLRKKGRLY